MIPLTKADCPPGDVWQRIVANGFTDSSGADLLSHLDRCSICQSAVEGLMRGERTWQAIATELRRELPAASPHCRKALDGVQKGSVMSKNESVKEAPAKDARRADVAAVVQRIVANIEKVILGKRSQITLALVAYLCEGHILLEDVPGVAKTMLARALARSVNTTFKRVQCTPDLLPNDITGASIFNPKTTEFEFRPGPLFAQIVLADEINRTTPRTQAALLEAMAERKVTADGTNYP